MPAAAHATFPGRPGLIVFNLTFHAGIDDPPAPERGGLYAVRAGGHSPRQLTEDPSDQEPSFAPSGKRLVFERLTGPTAGEPYYKTSLYMLEMGSRKLTRLTGGHGDHSPSFGRRGTIVFSRYRPAAKSSDLVLRTADGRLRRLTSGAGDDRHSVFTPNGRRVVFLRQVGKGWQINLCSIRLDGSGLRVLARDGSPNYLDLSPNGRRVALNAWYRTEEGETPGSVWTKLLAAARPRFHLPNAEAAAFSPGGRRLVYTNDEGLWLRRADGGGNRVQVFRADYDDFDGGRRARTAAWQPLP
jgi:Tol biopolymer transport system component